MAVLLDISPLRESPPFRRYFFSQLVSLAGSMMTAVALRYQAYKLGGNSTSAVAALALVTLFPFVISSMYGGAIADAFDKRKVLIITQVLLGMTSLGLALNASMHRPRLWVVFVLAFVSNALVGVDWPTRSASVAGLVGKERIHAAVTLMIAVFNIATIGGPVLAGFLVARFTPLLFGLDALTYLVSLVGVWSLPALLPSGERRSVRVRTIVEGFRYVQHDRVIQSTFVADLVAMVFGAPDALFPAMAERIFHNTHALGFLQAAPAAGSVLAGAISGWTKHVRKQGVAVLWCIAAWGVGIAVFGATRLLPLALLGLFVAGFADAISAIFRSTIVQETVPDEYRGRLSSIFVAVVRGGPKLGEMESGAAARIGGLQFAGFSGGLACIGLIGVVALIYPELRNYTVHQREDLS